MYLTLLYTIISLVLNTKIIVLIFETISDYVCFTDRSTSTGNLLAQKQEKFYSLQCDLNDVSNGHKVFQGKMLKKLKPSETEKLALLLTRCNTKARNLLKDSSKNRTK